MTICELYNLLEKCIDCDGLSINSDVLIGQKCSDSIATMIKAHSVSHTYITKDKQLIIAYE